MNRQEYWSQVYQTEGPEDISWYQRRPDLSLALIAASGLGKDAGIIDVGGGASTLVDFQGGEVGSGLAITHLWVGLNPRTPRVRRHHPHVGRSVGGRCRHSSA